jgi:hypothetical protein
MKRRATLCFSILLDSSNFFSDAGFGDGDTKLREKYERSCLKGRK